MTSLRTLAAATCVAATALVPSVLTAPAGATPVAPTASGVLPQKTHFDVQAHRGGLGLTTESTPQAFAKALSMGVTTLELDTQVTEDERVVVTHDRQVSPQKCAGVTALSPNYGFPQSGKVGDPGFRFYPSEQMVADAHARGLEVVPWTCDDPATMEALLDMGVDGIITDYPDRLRAVMAERGMRLPKAYPAS